MSKWLSLNTVEKQIDKKEEEIANENEEEKETDFDAPDETDFGAASTDCSSDSESSTGVDLDPGSGK